MNTCLLGPASSTKFHHVTTSHTLATIWLLTYLRSKVNTVSIRIKTLKFMQNIIYFTNATSFPPGRTCSLIINLVFEKQFKNISNQWCCGSLWQYKDSTQLMTHLKISTIVNFGFFCLSLWIQILSFLTASLQPRSLDLKLY